MSILSRIWEPFRAKAANSQSLPTVSAGDLRAGLPRYQLPHLSSITPDSIRQTLVGAINGRLEESYKLFDLMEDTWPRLASNLAKLRAAVRAHDWTLQPWTGATGEATEEAQRRATELGNMIWLLRPDPSRDHLDFPGILDALMDAWAKGVSVVGLLWEGRRLRAGYWLHPRYYEWASVNTPEVGEDRLMLRADLLASAYPTLFATGQRYAAITPGEFLVAVARSRMNHPTVSARLRALAWWWCAMNFGAEWLLQNAQLFGIPLRWATYPPARKDLVPVIESMMRQLGASGWGVFPQGTQLNLIESVKPAQSNPQSQIIELADKYCDLLILGQTLAQDVGSTGGNRALGEVHRDVELGVLESAIRWLASILNAQLVPEMCRRIYGDDRNCPYFLERSPQQKDLNTIAGVISSALSMGLTVPRDWAYEQLGIPIPAEDETVIGAPPAPPSPEAGGGGAGGPPAQAAARFGALPVTYGRERLARAYRGALREFLRVLESSSSPDEALRKLREHYRNWAPDELADEIEVALQLAAAQGARHGTTAR